MTAIFNADSELPEEHRLRALENTGLLEGGPDPEFDEIVRLASTVCGAPISGMTLLDRTSQFTKAVTGLPTLDVPREYALCDYTVRGRQMFTIPDTRSDLRFVSNPLVTGDPHIRFYCGVPLQMEDGAAVGALCVLDTRPRELTKEQEWSLQVLGRLLSARVQLRANARALEARNHELEQERELLRMFLDSLPMEACLKDEEGRFLLYNQAIAEHFGISSEAWLGKTDHDLFEKDKADQLRTEEEYVMRSGKRHESYIELDAPVHGREYWKLIKAPLQTTNRKSLLTTVAINLTPELKREAELVKLQEELEEANRKLRSLALTDPLTGLWNRRAFDARLETEIYRAERSGMPLMLLLCDIDDFKSLNDTFGHGYGDEVLKQVGAVLLRTVRAEDVSARYGGEEFAMVLPQCQADAAKLLCTRIASMLERVRWKHRGVTLSVGIAPFHPGLTSDQLLDRADHAMYQAKRDGKNCHVVYEGEEAS